MEVRVCQQQVDSPAASRSNSALVPARSGAGHLVFRQLLGALTMAAVVGVLTGPCAGLWQAPAAYADDAKIAAKQKVLILRTDGATVTDIQRQAASKELQNQALRYRQLDIVFAAGDLTEEMFEFECTDPGVECLGKIANKYKAQLVVYSELTKNPSGQLHLNMRVIDSSQNRVAQSTVQPLASLDKPTSAVQRGLVVLLGPVDLPSDAAEAIGTIQVVLFGGGVALVYIDDKLVGRTSVTGLKVQVSAGSHTLRVVRAGFKEWTAKVNVNAGAVVEQAVQLEQQALVQDPTGLGGLPGKPVETPLVQKGWFWGAIGVGVVAIGVATWLLLRGDDAPKTGSVAVSLDHADAYLDPVFGGATGK